MVGIDEFLAIKRQNRLSDLDILFLVALNGSDKPRAVGDVGKQLNVATGSASRICTGLAKAGLVERKHDVGKDWRTTFVVITEKGKDICERLVDV